MFDIPNCNIIRGPQKLLMMAKQRNEMLFKLQN